MEQIPFISSAPNTLGIELELQLIDPRSFDLTAASDELLAQMANHPIADRVKPEITRSMIELNSSVHEHPMGLLAEMREMRDALVEAADAVGVSVAAVSYTHLDVYKRQIFSSYHSKTPLSLR